MYYFSYQTSVKLIAASCGLSLFKAQFIYLNKKYLKTLQKYFAYENLSFKMIM